MNPGLTFETICIFGAIIRIFLYRYIYMCIDLYSYLYTCFYVYTYMYVSLYIHIDGTLCVLGSVIASIVFLFINGFITTADLRAWYYDNDYIVRNRDKIMSIMEKVGESNPVAWKAVKSFKELRPDYMFERSNSDSWKVLNPANSTKGGNIISATPDTPRATPVTSSKIKSSRTKSVFTDSFTSIHPFFNSNRISNINQILAEEETPISRRTNEA
jgi:hypothetical protein